MHGADKGLLRIDGEPAVVRIARSLSPHCDQLIISANRNIKQYESLQTGQVITDLRPDFAGPLAGLEALTEYPKTDIFLTVPCDMPRLPASVFEKLLRTLLSDSTLDAVFAITKNGPQYLCAALRQRSISTLPELLDGGVRAVREWYATLRTEEVSFEKANPAFFQNWNSPEEWADKRND